MIEARKTEGSSGKSKIRTAGGASVSSSHFFHFLLLSWTAASSTQWRQQAPPKC